MAVLEVKYQGYDDITLNFSIMVLYLNVKTRQSYPNKVKGTLMQI